MIDMNFDRDQFVWTDEKIIEALRADADRRGRTPGRNDFDVHREGRPSAMTVIRRFGTWNAAVQAAGLPTRSQGMRLKVDVAAIERRKKKARRLREDGASLNEIANTLGISKSQARRDYLGLENNRGQ